MNEQRLEQAVSFIERITKDLPHGNKTFYEHLMGTFKFLLKTGESETICLAGLYHSVYDTFYYTANLEVTRDQIIELIGEEAEDLVFKFCNLEHRTDRLLFCNDYDLQTQISLLKIEYANYYDLNFEPNDITEQMIFIDKKLQWLKSL